MRKQRPPSDCSRYVACSISRYPSPERLAAMFGLRHSVYVTIDGLPRYTGAGVGDNVRQLWQGLVGYGDTRAND